MSARQLAGSSFKESSSINPDFVKERTASSCDAKELAIIVGEETLHQRRKFVESLIKDNPHFNDWDRYHQDHTQIFEAAIRRHCEWVKIKQQNNLSVEEGNLIYSVFLNDLSFGIHDAMFVPTIRRLANDQQRSKWLPLAENYEILGSYAQTELGHGTYLNGLETTATFDQETQEFVLNTPTISSMKWWPGSLGVVVNHAVVLAQLIVNGQRIGPQAFLVQIRDRETHQPLPGCHPGDIGPKWGFNGATNGYLRLDHVRIPRDQMLSKYLEVTSSGQLVSHGNPKVTYGTMIEMRCNLVADSANLLNKAVTIAIRYSVARRQGTIDASQGEVQILDYQSQQDKLFPLLATSYCFSFVAQSLMQMYKSSESAIQQGDFSKLPELHALSCGLKALLGDVMSKGCNTCRFSCGGHGYMLASGLPWLYERGSVINTVEGEKSPIFLQTARSLVKILGNPQAANLSEGAFTQYLLRPVTLKWQPRVRGQVRNPDNVTGAFRHRAQRLVMRAADRVATLMKEGHSQARSWNESQVFLVQCAQAHVELYCVEVFFDKLSTLHDASKGNREALHRLALLFALHMIRTDTGDFSEDGFASREQLSWVNDEYFSLLKELRPDALSLVDGFDNSDFTLHSVLGCFDGNVYQRLYESTKLEPKNQKVVPDVFHKYLGPFMKGQSKL
ncbi:putative peroxisomal acyl-coenzyme A oxidase 1-like [Apostichopus japonicus]|uniref:Acyl-coenzyme A oxidase n=1 Tax=Stichopus japonicus TaxID=307972 RepID=A0A2G8L7S3_STIJA|nr:putative peroxisomal acyl-coenzyme A oxidase 1-like [Apostichopus japonicus]